MTDDLELIVPDWRAPAPVRAVVTTRKGGVSQRDWSSLNLATHVGDNPQHVMANRDRLQVALGLPAEPLWLEQVHGVEVVDVANAAVGTEADAAVAFAAEQVCAVMTADCLPVLFCSRQGDRVAAAHAGWRGLLGGVLEAAVSRLGISGDELMAWLGPAIGPSSFEVGEEVYDAFVGQDGSSESAFLPGQQSGKYMADIYALARQRLHQMGVSEIGGGAFCTYQEEARFFSYRRDGQCGRMASLIWLDASSG